MSEDRLSPPAPDGAAPPDAWAAADDRRAAVRLEAAVADLFVDRRDRLHERIRVAALAVLEAAVAAAEHDLRGQLPETLSTTANTSVHDRLYASGLLRDPALVEEAVAQARIAAIDEALAAQRPPGTATDLLERLAAADDRAVRGATLAYLIADNRRGQATGDVPAPLYRRLIWWIAAALRERGGGDPATDRALATAAERGIAAREETTDVTQAAVALAAAIDATPDELGALLLQALHAGRAMLFVALLARALAMEAGEARAIVLDADGARLWCALRAVELPRETIARIGWSLSEADAAREVEALPAAIDRCEAMTPAAARRALATLALPPSFRAAVRALGRAA